MRMSREQLSAMDAILTEDRSYLDVGLRLPGRTIRDVS